ncbi:hypothetical protein [Actinomadura gamaensis]|uniref:Lipoprotein n=1 Tax=Actinomadura gamaensis TaxID=1763541 RepID=A0ABV9TRP3_9ACTN
MMARGVTAVLVGAILLTGCGSRSGDAKGDGVHDSTSVTGASSTKGGDGPVLRWRMTGGIAGIGGPMAVPDFSLYPDGTAIVPTGRGKAQLRRYHLKQPAVQRLVDEARRAGLQQSRRIGTDAHIADAMVLVMQMGSAQTEIVQPESQDVPATRLWKKLQPEQWPKSDQQSPPDAYQPERVAVNALGTGEHPAAGMPAWPLSPLGEGRKMPGGLCTVYSGKDAATVRDLAARTPLGTRFTSGGAVYTVRVRPLLPDEKSCAALA